MTVIKFEVIIFYKCVCIFKLFPTLGILQDKGSGEKVVEIFQHVATPVVFYIMMHLPFSKNCYLSNEMTNEYTNLIIEACDLQCIFALLNLFSALCFLRLSCGNIYVTALFQFVCDFELFSANTRLSKNYSLFVYFV